MMRPSARPYSPPLANASCGRKVAAVAAAATMAAVSRAGCAVTAAVCRDVDRGLKLVSWLTSRWASPSGSKLGRNACAQVASAANVPNRMLAKRLSPIPLLPPDVSFNPALARPCETLGNFSSQRKPRDSAPFALARRLRAEITESKAPRNDRRRQKKRVLS